MFPFKFFYKLIANQKLIYLTKRYCSSNENKWLEESPVEELVLTKDSIKRTGFSGKKGILYNTVSNGL